jgi:hypothetical protein
MNSPLRYTDPTGENPLAATAALCFTPIGFVVCVGAAYAIYELATLCTETIDRAFGNGGKILGMGDVIPFPQSKPKPQSSAPEWWEPPGGGNSCPVQQKVLEQLKTLILNHALRGEMGQYANGAKGLNDDIARHNARCPLNQVSPLPIGPVR